MSYQQQSYSSQASQSPPTFRKIGFRSGQAGQSERYDNDHGVSTQASYGQVSVPRHDGSNVAVYVTGDEGEEVPREQNIHVPVQYQSLPNQSGRSAGLGYQPESSRDQQVYGQRVLTRGTMPEPMAPVVAQNTNPRPILKQSSPSDMFYSEPQPANTQYKSSTVPAYQSASSGGLPYRANQEPKAEQASVRDMKSSLVNRSPAMFQLKPDVAISEQKSENEVDNLTSLLMQNMKAAENPDFLGKLKHFH